MLKRFTVSNFKNFNNETTLDFSAYEDYDFNEDIIQQGCISKAMIFGINGSGKSNLALAIFDIILHLTDKERAIDKYQLFLNMVSHKPVAEFEYVFSFDGEEVVYSYAKFGPMNLSYERLMISGEEVLFYDHQNQKGGTSLKGAETLQLDAEGVFGLETLSRVKYIRSNAILSDDPVNNLFKNFVSFVDGMLMFYSLNENRYQGFVVGRGSYTHGIIAEKKLQEFELFLKEWGIEYDLVALDMNGQSEIYCKYSRGNVPFQSIASTGTKSLALFYYWYIQMEKASLIYIDEYDAFYHFELAQGIVQRLRGMEGKQVILSTHNTDLLSNDLLRPDAYFQINDNQIRSFDRLTDRELRKAHNIQKMYKAGEFNE